MKILIPMAGLGHRFVRAGYADPKPLIPIRDADGSRRPIIERVVGMFAPSDEFVFICNNRHLAETNMRDAILALCPWAEIIGIPEHRLGPVFTVRAAFEFIRNDERVIVAYCDGAIVWDRTRFDGYVTREKLDGCLFTHTGFHPHTLSRTRMAFLKIDGDGMVGEVKEKQSFTDDPLSEHASSGVYYFARGEQLKYYFDRSLNEGVAHKGEHYVTLVYNLMIADGLRVGYFDTPGVAILGTPGEVANFEAWSTILGGDQVRNESDAMRCYRYWREYHQIRCST